MMRVKKVLIYSLIVLLILLALSSGAGMFANLVAHQTEKQEELWLEGKEVTARDWVIAKQNLQISLMFSPFNPDYLQTLGRLHYYQMFIDADELPSPYAEGIPYIRESIQVRPYWPYAWADLALIKSLAGELDDEFDQALRLAEKYGPWEKQVINSLILTYFRVWGALTESQKVRAHALVLRILDYDEQSARMGLDLALETELNPFLCVDQYQKIKSFGLQEFCPDFDDDPSNMPLIFPVQ